MTFQTPALSAEKVCLILCQATQEYTRRVPPGQTPMVIGRFRYFFDLDGPDERNDNHTDGDGTNLPHDDAAFDHAKRVIEELKGTGAYDHPAWHVVVKDENRDIVFRVPFQSVQPAKIVTVVASILPFIRPRSDFDDNVTRMLGEAFDAACKELHDGHPDDAREVIARRIIEAARLGERDIVRLRDGALAALDRRQAQ